MSSRDVDLLAVVDYATGWRQRLYSAQGSSEAMNVLANELFSALIGERERANVATQAVERLKGLLAESEGARARLEALLMDDPFLDREA